MLKRSIEGDGSYGGEVGDLPARRDFVIADWFVTASRPGAEAEDSNIVGGGVSEAESPGLPLRPLWICSSPLRRSGIDSRHCAARFGLGEAGLELRCTELKGLPFCSVGGTMPGNAGPVRVCFCANKTGYVLKEIMLTCIRLP